MTRLWRNREKLTPGPAPSDDRLQSVVIRCLRKRNERERERQLRNDRPYDLSSDAFFRVRPAMKALNTVQWLAREVGMSELERIWEDGLHAASNTAPIPSGEANSTAPPTTPNKASASMVSASNVSARSLFSRPPTAGLTKPDPIG